MTCSIDRTATISRSTFRVSPVAAVAALVLSGCAVTTFEVEKKAEARHVEIQQSLVETKLPDQVAPVPGLRKMAGNFLGSKPIPISHSVSLPPHVRNITMSFGNGRGTLIDVGRNIRTATGIAVRINPDAFNGSDGIQQSVSMPSETEPSPLASPMPLPGQLPAAEDFSQITPASTGRLPLSFKGDLADYLNTIGSIMDVNWEYANGEINIYRMMTRRFQLAVSPGTLAYRDDVSSGGSGSGGSSDTAGTFASTSTASVDAQLSPWQGIEDAIRSMLSDSGKVHVNQASGAIVVTDTKAKVEQVGKYIDSENDLLNRQIRIEMREILVERTGESSVGLDVAIVYNRFLDAGLDVNAGLGAAGDLITGANPVPNYSINTTVPGSLANPASGTMTVNFQRQGYFQGSQAALQALNGIGKVVADTTRTIVTTNRTPGRLQDVIDRAYLAETKPASGGALDGGAGVPGLVPGLVTYGENITVVPTVGDDSRITLQMFSTRSSLIELNSQSAGTGATFQQINTPVLQRKKNSQNIRMRNNETLVIVSNAAENWSSKDRQAVTGASTIAQRSNVTSILMVTPRVMGL